MENGLLFVVRAAGVGAGAEAWAGAGAGEGARADAMFLFVVGSDGVVSLDFLDSLSLTEPKKDLRMATVSQFAISLRRVAGRVGGEMLNRIANCPWMVADCFFDHGAYQQATKRLVDEA